MSCRLWRLTRQTGICSIPLLNQRPTSDDNDEEEERVVDNEIDVDDHYYVEDENDDDDYDDNASNTDFGDAILIHTIDRQDFWSFNKIIRFIKLIILVIIIIVVGGGVNSSSNNSDKSSNNSSSRNLIIARNLPVTVCHRPRLYVYVHYYVIIMKINIFRPSVICCTSVSKSCLHLVDSMRLS